MSEEDVRKEIQRLNDLYIKEIDKKIVYSKEVVDCLIDAKTNKLEQENKQLKDKLKGVQEERDYLFNKLSIENKQLKLDHELYKDNCVYRNYEVEIRDNTIKQLKEVIEEAREYMKKHPCDTWYYSKKKSDKFLDIEIIRCDEELLQILDKVKENK